MTPDFQLSRLLLVALTYYMSPLIMRLSCNFLKRGLEK